MVKPEYALYVPNLNQDKITQTYNIDVEWWRDNQDSAQEAWTRITAG